MDEALLRKVNKQLNYQDLCVKVCEWLIQQKDIPAILKWIQMELLDGYMEDDEFDQFDTFIKELKEHIKKLKDAK